MNIQSASLSQYSYTSNQSQLIQSTRAQDQIKESQKQTNQQISSTKETQQGNSQKNENTKETENTKKFVDGKAVQASEKSLNEAELKEVLSLKSRDAEVKAHEAAHLARAGKYATGGASFEYQRGPDGKSYAVGGEVGIDTSPVPDDPQATIAKAEQIQAAANAPASPSSQDRQVAAQARVMATEARTEVSQQKTEETTTETNKPETDTAASEANDKNSEVGEETKNETPPENKKASNEYQSIAAYTNDTGATLLELIA